MTYDLFMTPTSFILIFDMCRILAETVLETRHIKLIQMMKFFFFGGFRFKVLSEETTIITEVKQKLI